MKWSGFIVKDCFFCYSMCFSRICDFLEKLLAEEESKWGTEMNKKWRSRKEEGAAYFSVVGKSTNSVLASAERCIQREATLTPQLHIHIWAKN